VDLEHVLSVNYQLSVVPRLATRWSHSGGRRHLGRALTAEGFVNYPTEWWRWSFGDRYWALLTGAANACYGPCRPDARG